jgi:hypothetical protein
MPAVPILVNGRQEFPRKAGTIQNLNDATYHMGIGKIYTHRLEKILNLSYGASALVISLEKCQTETRQTCKFSKN